LSGDINSQSNGYKLVSGQTETKVLLYDIKFGVISETRIIGSIFFSGTATSGGYSGHILAPVLSDEENEWVLPARWCTYSYPVSQWPPYITFFGSKYLISHHLWPVYSPSMMPLDCYL